MDNQQTVRGMEGDVADARPVLPVQKDVEFLRLHVRMIETQLNDMQFGADEMPVIPVATSGDEFAFDLVEHPWRTDITGNKIKVTPGIVWLENSPVLISPADITATAAGKAWIQETGSASGGVGSLSAAFGYGATWPTISDTVRYCRLFEWTWVAGTPTGTATLLEQYQWSDVSQFAGNGADPATGKIIEAKTTLPADPGAAGWLLDFSFRGMRLADHSVFVTLGLVVL